MLLKQVIFYRLKIFIISYIGLCLLSACSLHIPIDRKPNTIASKKNQIDSQRPKSYYVRKGDTLYSVAFRYGLDYRILATWNNIPYPYTIYPKQIIFLFPTKQPIQSHNTVSKNSTTAAVVSQPKETASKKPSKQFSTPQSTTGPKEAQITKQPVVVSKNTAKMDATTAKPQKKTLPKQPINYDKKAKWNWPVSGKIYRTFSTNDRARKGIDIVGKEGQVITAAKSGLVVYSGNGLPGYGELIIIKHGSDFLSAYGYNKKRLVKEGDTVQTGQKIAQMGNSIVDKRPMLHFEIRYKSKPVNPLKYLPKK